ncbi:hypothetical protein SCARD494_00189 [Seiridium cardinale]
MPCTISLAVVALLASLASSMPNIQARTTDALTPWVSVDESGTGHTVTPYVTTIDGAATTVSGAPNQITGSVFTQTNYGQVTTSTGTAPMPTATTTNGTGSFPVCSNKDGINAPWCLPSDGANLYPGTTYYFTWDSSYFAANTTIMIQGNYFNQSTGVITSQAFQSDKMVASWGFWSLTVDSSLMQGKSGKNISVQITGVNTSTSTNSLFVKGPTILVTNTPVYHQTAAKLPDGAALYIGLPSILGFVILCVAGTCIWNRKHRKINIGNIMSRTRHGHGLGSAGRRMGLGKRRREKEAAERVQLMEREVAANGGQVYRDEPRSTYIDIARRDSDALGSLAGTPTEERRMDYQHSGTRDAGDRPAGGDRNLFRDELRRQDQGRV